MATARVERLWFDSRKKLKEEFLGSFTVATAHDPVRCVNWSGSQPFSLDADLVSLVLPAGCVFPASVPSKSWVWVFLCTENAAAGFNANGGVWTTHARQDRSAVEAKVRQRIRYRAKNMAKPLSFDTKEQDWVLDFTKLHPELVFALRVTVTP